MKSSNAPLLLAVAGIGSDSGGSVNCLLGHEHGKLLSGSHSPFGWRTAVIGVLCLPPLFPQIEGTRSGVDLDIGLGIGSSYGESHSLQVL